MVLPQEDLSAVTETSVPSAPPANDITSSAPLPLLAQKSLHLIAFLMVGCLFSAMVYSLLAVWIVGGHSSWSLRDVANLEGDAQKFALLLLIPALAIFPINSLAGTTIYFLYRLTRQ